MAALRLHLLLGSALLATGCAQQPVTADRTPAPAVAAATPAQTAASLHAMKAAVPPDILLFAHDQGFRQVVIKGGNYYFCKTEDPMGSIIPTRRCLDQVQMESLRVQVQQQQEELSRRAPETRKSTGP